MISRLVNSLFGIYWWLIILRIFLTWIPSIDWYKQPFAFLKNVVDPFLEPFRRLVPPIGGLDISPIIAILALQMFFNFLVIPILRSFGL